MLLGVRSVCAVYIIMSISSVDLHDLKAKELVDTWAEAVAHVPGGEEVIDDVDRADLRARTGELWCISVAWFLRPGVSHREAIQQAIDAEQPKNNAQRQRFVLIPNLGFNWKLDDQVKILGVKRKTIVLQSGVVITVEDGAYSDRFAAKNMFYIAHKPPAPVERTENLLICGQTLVKGEPVATSERPRFSMFPAHDADRRFNGGPDGSRVQKNPDPGTRMGVSIEGHVTNVELRSFDIRNCGGDGIKVRGDGENITIDDMVVAGNLRNNITVTNVSSIRILNSQLNNAYLTWGAGLDVEPDPGESPRNILVEGCKFLNNLGYGISLEYERPRPYKGPGEGEHAVIIRDCFVKCMDPKGRTRFGIKIGPVTMDKYNTPRHLDCLLENVKVQGAPAIAYWMMGLNSPRCRVTLKDCWHLEEKEVEPTLAGCDKGNYEHPSVIAVDGNDNNRFGDMYVQSALNVINMRFGYQGEVFEKPANPVRHLLQVCRCKSGQISLNGTVYSLPDEK